MQNKSQRVDRNMNQYYNLEKAKKNTCITVPGIIYCFLSSLFSVTTIFRYIAADILNHLDMSSYMFVD